MSNTPVQVKQRPAPARTPADPWQSLRTEMDRLFDRFTAGFAMPSFREMFDTPAFATASSVMRPPAIDVSEDAAAYTITAELPGVSERDLDITMSNGMLVIKGEKRQESEQKDKNYYVSERSYGGFQRSFAVPEGVDDSKVAAQFAKGVLTITLPKTQAAQQSQKKIEVNAAS